MGKIPGAATGHTLGKILGVATGLWSMIWTLKNNIKIDPSSKEENKTKQNFFKGLKKV